jgi:hypothetical protein
MLAEALLLLTAPAALDAFVGVALLRASRRARGGAGPPAPFRWLVLVPSRAEGERVEGSLASVAEAAREAPPGITVRTLLLLDGEDEASRARAGRLGAEVALKEPPGPTKGALLGWASSREETGLDASDGVLVLDVGSAVSPGFFSRFALPPGCAGSQALLRGTGEGPGAAASASERFAQEVEDRGRQALGWAVRLRGTGTALSPAAFRSVAPRLRTRVEDLEASLLLSGRDGRLVLGEPGAEVLDLKPSDVSRAAAQRARWLLGRWSLALRHLPELLRLSASRPAEGFAFACEIAARPLSLWLPARLLAAGALSLSWAGGGPAWHLASAAAEGASVVATFAVLWSAGALSGGAGPAVSLLLAWLRAIVLLPSALFRWMRARP